MEDLSKKMQHIIENLDEKYITLNGVRVRYVVKGDSSPVLLLHGFGEFLESWVFNIDPLSEHYRVYALDLPGHGLSEKPATDYSLPAAVKFITDFMQTMGIERASLIGHSIGGHISLKMAISSPDKVNKIIPVDSVGLTYKTPLLYRLCALPVLGDIFIKPTVKAGLRQGMKRAFYNQDRITEEMIDLDYKYLKMPGAKRAMLSIIRSGIGLNGPRPEAIILDKLHMVRSPTMFIHGAQDRAIPLKYAKHASRLIPGARLKVIEACGHCPHIEKADEFNEAVIAFLDSN